MGTLSFNQFYKAWRNKARRHSVQGLVEGAMDVLQSKGPSKVEELKRAPWHLMLIVKWACLDPMLPLGGPRVSGSSLDELRQGLWDLPEQVNHGISGERPVRLWMRQLLYPQIQFQRRADAGFLREAALLESLGLDHPLCVMFEEQAGFGIRLFQDISFAMFAELAAGTLRLTTSFFRPLLQTYTDEALTAAVRSFAITPEELVDFFRVTDPKQRYMAEYFEFTPLTRHPFLRQDQVLQAWHPMVFYRGMEGFVHSVLSARGAEYMELFSKVFERHIVAESRKINTRFYSEAELQQWLPPDTECPDGLMAFDDCHIYIEAKAGLFASSIMTVGDTQALAHRSKALRKGTRQAWATVEALTCANGAPDNRGGENFLIVVVNKELGIPNGAMLEKMAPVGWLDPPTAIAGTLLPPEHIYFVPVQDFERLMRASQNGEVRLPEFLRHCVQQDASMVTSVQFLQQRLDQERIPYGYSDLVLNTVNAVGGRLEKMVEADQRANAI